MVADLANARIRRFQQLLAEDLPALFDRFGPADQVRAVLARHAGDLRRWRSGILEWHRTCRRYGEAALVADRTPVRGGSARPRAGSPRPVRTA